MAEQFYICHCGHVVRFYVGFVMTCSGTTNSPKHVFSVA